MRSFAVIVALSLLLIGCAHPPVLGSQEKLVHVSCVVESYDPDALVFYDTRGLPYDGRSRVSHVRVIAPRDLVGRVYAIDLLSARDQKEHGFDDLRRSGAVVHFKLRSSLASYTERQMIPVYELTP